MMDIIIKNVKTPIVLQDILKWDLLNWDLNKWKQILGDEKLVFRSGKHSFTPEPQFENLTNTVEMTFEEFINVKTNKEWFYFDYKYLKDWLLNCDELRKSICWDALGFPNTSAEDSTIWIGSKGAHTPCHIDSYGCNIIVQVYGRKRWLLFPPKEDLKPTRIPYEESSIFSKINFYAPSSSSFKDITCCYDVILNPGDVLIVPHNWWHYVENLEIAISINTWIKLPVDYEERVKEALVQTTVIQYLKGLEPSIQKKLVTTSVDLNMFNEALPESVALIGNTKKQLEEHKIGVKTNTLDVTAMIEKSSNIKILKPLTQNELEVLLQSQSSRFTTNDTYEEISQTFSNDLRRVIDAVLHPDVVHMIYQKLGDL